AMMSRSLLESWARAGAQGDCASVRMSANDRALPVRRIACPQCMSVLLLRLPRIARPERALARQRYVKAMRRGKYGEVQVTVALSFVRMATAARRESRGSGEAGRASVRLA